MAAKKSESWFPAVNEGKVLAWSEWAIRYQIVVASALWIWISHIFF
jgi:hypothetical protein